jgi:hypothetical protein
VSTIDTVSVVTDLGIWSAAAWLVVKVLRTERADRARARHRRRSP